MPTPATEKLRPSYDFDSGRLDKLKKLVPEAFEDGKLNPEALRDLFESETTSEGEQEHFSLSWPGKREAKRLAGKPGKGTLAPEQGEGANEQAAENVFIEGDNLEALRLLQKSYGDRVKLIYIDPPYNTGGDFLYNDSFKDSLDAYLEGQGLVDESGALLTTNRKRDGRFHSKWLSMMYPRLRLARELLREDGLMFVSIDNGELPHLISIMNEIFGEENQEEIVAWRRRHNQPNDATKMISKVAEFLVVYAKNSEHLKKEDTFYGVPLSEERKSRYKNPDNDPKGRWGSKPWKSGSNQSGTTYSITTPTGTEYTEEWLGTKETFEALREDGRIYFTRDGDGLPRKKFYLSEREKEGQPAHNFWGHERFGSNQEASAELESLFGGKSVFKNPKPTRLIQQIVKIGSAGEDIILDFFAGTGTSAHAVLKQNAKDGYERKFINCQLPEAIEEDEPAYELGYENISDLAKERLRRAVRMQNEEAEANVGFKCYRLAESNYKEWENYKGENTEEIEGLFERFETPLVEDWSEDDLLVEVLLMQGYPLTSRVEKAERFEENEVYEVTTGFFSARMFVCFDGEVERATTEALDLSSEDTFVCLDAALSDEMKVKLSDAGTLKVI